MEHVEQATAAPGEKRELPQIERIQVVSVEPGDRVIVSLPGSTTREQVEMLRGMLREEFPDNRVMVLVGGIEFSVTRG